MVAHIAHEHLPAAHRHTNRLAELALPVTLTSPLPQIRAVQTKHLNKIVAPIEYAAKSMSLGTREQSWSVAGAASQGCPPISGLVAGLQ